MFFFSAGKWGSSRFCLSYMTFFGFATIYAQRVVLSVAILSMVNSTDQLQESSTISNSTCDHVKVDSSVQMVSSMKA